MAKPKEDNLDFEIALLESIHRRDDGDARVIEVLAHLYTETGRYKEGLQLDLRHVELEPANASAHYNLACSFCLLDRIDEALDSLRTALERGFAELDWVMKDPDLRELRRDPRFHTLLHEFQVNS